MNSNKDDRITLYKVITLLDVVGKSASAELDANEGDNNADNTRAIDVFNKSTDLYHSANDILEDRIAPSEIVQATKSCIKTSLELFEEEDCSNIVLSYLDEAMEGITAAVALNESDNQADIDRAKRMFSDADYLLREVFHVMELSKNCNVPEGIVVATLSCFYSAEKLFESKSKFRVSVLEMENVRAAIAGDGESCDMACLNSPILTDDEAVDTNDYNNPILIETEADNSKDVSDN